MSKIIIPDLRDPHTNHAEAIQAQVSRQTFLKYFGTASALGALLLTNASCKNDDDDVTPPAMGSVDLGSGDFGILNYAYALEQLEAAFYSQVISTKYSGMSTAEQQILTEIRDHELAHRDFFKAALGSNAIAGLEVDFSAINFGDRASVLGAAKTFEDLGVAAYNGAGRLITSADYLLIAGKIVSVEARHAAIIRDLLMPFTADFAGDDVVSTDKGLDGAKTPTEVLTAAKPFVKTTINFANLPK